MATQPNVTSSETTKTYEEILKSNGILDPVSQVLVKNSAPGGGNFGSQTQTVTVLFKNADKKPLNLFAKVVTAGKSHLDMTEGGKLFVKEATFFTKYLPVAREVCKTLGQEHLIEKLYPKCYFADEKMIVLENLALDKGFAILDRDGHQDFETAKFCLTSIARHHAISRAVVESLGNSEIFFKRFPYLDFEGFAQPWAYNLIGNMMEKATSRSLALLQNTEIEGKEEAIKFFTPKLGKVYESFLSATVRSPGDEKLSVLNHGDFHNNNMMFRKDPETGKVTDHILIDLQVTRYGSPCLDIHCYLSGTIPTSLRREKLHELLQFYLKEFTKTLAALNCPIDVTYEEFYKNFRQKVMYGFWFSVLMENGLILNASKDLKPEEVNEIGTKMDSFIARWLEEHPEERTEHVKEFLRVFNEYNPVEFD